MWVKIFDTKGSEFKYEVYPAYSEELIQNDGVPTTIFTIVRYWKDNDGEWKRCSARSSAYIGLETLMRDFVLIDSPVDKKLLELNEFLKNVYAKNLEESISPFCLNKVVEVTDELLDNKNLDTGDKVTLMDYITA